MRKQWKMIKYKEEHEKCEICGHYATTVHHILPYSLGGEDEDYNFISLCEECHGKAHKYGISTGFLKKYKQRNKGTILNHIGLLKYIEMQTYDTLTYGSDIIQLINEYAEMDGNERRQVNTDYDLFELEKRVRTRREELRG